MECRAFSVFGVVNLQSVSEFYREFNGGVNISIGYRSMCDCV